MAKVLVMTVGVVTSVLPIVAVCVVVVAGEMVIGMVMLGPRFSACRKRKKNNNRGYDFDHEQTFVVGAAEERSVSIWKAA